MSDTSPDPVQPRQDAAVPAPPPLPVPAPPPAYPAYAAPAYPAPGMQPGVPMAMPVQGTRGMYTAAAILNWVGLGLFVVFTFGIGIIAAAWVVPMTIQIHKAAKGPYKHTALGVCTLIFINIISGILMLVDDSNRPARPVA